MTRSYQQGYVSEPIRTRRGIVFKIRYRIRGANGGWKQKSETLYGLSGVKAARSVLDQKVREATARPAAVTDLTLRDFVEAYWKPYLQRKAMKPSTIVGYSFALDKHVLPALGYHRLVDIGPMHIETFVQRKLDGQGKNKLNPKTVLNLLRLIQGIFSVAVDNDLVEKSPVRKKHRPIVLRTAKPAWSPEQVRAILDEIPTCYRPIFVCVALTGLRAGELLGLQWKHIDLERRELRVEQSLWHGQIVPPKTNASRDSVWFSDVLKLVFTEHRQNSNFTQSDDFVFCNDEGKPLSADVLRRDVLYPALHRLHIPKITGASGFHAFRHTAGSVIEHETGRLKLTQRFLRHSNIGTTADVYTHTSKEAEREAASALENAYFGNLFPVVPNLQTGNKKTALN